VYGAKETDMKTAADILTCRISELITAGPETTIKDALRLMAKHNIGALFIEDNGKVVGVWTERDHLRNSILPEFDIETARLKDYMTTGLIAAPHTAGIYKLLDMYLGLRLRHLLIEKDGTYIGMVSSGDAVRAALVEKTEELEKLSSFVNWEYYENWRWDKK